ncbi:MAG: hypothetical protein NUW23_05665 [Firmicutes bacterium]|jgi:hypothetical protein|nr:hypothetical protein [Bacillota bacterium]
MKGTIRIFTAVTLGANGRPGCALLHVQDSHRRVLSEVVQPINAPPSSGIRGARFAALVAALDAGRKFRASSVEVHTEDPSLVDAVYKKAGVNPELVGLYLQARANMHRYKEAKISYAPYPAMSDFPLIAAGC